MQFILHCFPPHNLYFSSSPPLFFLFVFCFFSCLLARLDSSSDTVGKDITWYCCLYSCCTNFLFSKMLLKAVAAHPVKAPNTIQKHLGYSQHAARIWLDYMCQIRHSVLYQRKPRSYCPKLAWVWSWWQYASGLEAGCCARNVGPASWPATSFPLGLGCVFHRCPGLYCAKPIWFWPTMFGFGQTGQVWKQATVLESSGRHFQEDSDQICHVYWACNFTKKKKKKNGARNNRSTVAQKAEITATFQKYPCGKLPTLKCCVVIAKLWVPHRCVAVPEMTTPVKWPLLLSTLDLPANCVIWAGQVQSVKGGI